ncbi:MAG: hypothetical protein ACF8PN_03615 [Phycisphaerales bacterium]
MPMDNEPDSGAIRGARILLLEDNFLVGLSLRRQLEELKCEVIGPMSTADEAVAAIAATAIDCGVLDINIRGGTSESVARALRSRSVPFLFISGYQSPALHDDWLRQAPRLIKPVENRVLERAIGSLIARETGEV